MATASEIFDRIAPGYAADPDKDFYLELADGRTSACAYGGNRNLAVALRAAHMIELAKGSDYAGSGGGGPVTSKKEGKLAISYGGGSSESDSNSDLPLTKYGRQLAGLARGNIAALGVCGGSGFGC